MQKILLGAVIVATALLVYTSLMTPQQSFAQTTTPDTSTNNAISGNGLQCNTTPPNRGLFLTFDGITGSNGNPCVFEIKDFSFGVENPTTIGSATGGAGAGKIKFNEFTITKTTDTASPVFFMNSATGAHYNNVIIHMRKAGGEQSTAGREFLQFKFGTVFTTKIDWSGPGDEGPEESITFVYGQLTIQYTPQKTDGTLGTPIISCWDTVRNTICAN